MSRNTLSNVFPAVIQEPVNQRIYYFSGDFASNEINFCTSMIKGFDKIKWFKYSDKPDDTGRFFWLYYKPLVNKIFSDYYVSLSGQK
jgi:hypothetical protein